MGPNPTDRAKNGVKRSLLVEANGGPLAVVIAGANVPDAQILAATIEAVVVERPEPEEDYLQHLCLDRGYDNEDGWGACVDHDYIPHIALIRDERPPRPKRYKPRRWVVERTLAWLSKCRAILVRWDKQAANYLGLLKLALRPALVPPLSSLGKAEIAPESAGAGSVASRVGGGRDEHLGERYPV